MDEMFSFEYMWLELWKQEMFKIKIPPVNLKGLHKYNDT